MKRRIVASLVSGILLLFVITIPPSNAAERKEFEGDWTCNWGGRVDVDVKITTGEKISVHYAWPISSLWGTKAAGDTNSEGKLIDDKLVFTFQYSGNPRERAGLYSDTTVTLWPDKDGQLAGKHSNRNGNFGGTCKRK